MLVAEAVGRALAQRGVPARLRPDRQRQLRGHQRAGGRRRHVRGGAPRGRRHLDGRRVRPGQRPGRRVQRAPGAGPDQHHDRPDRGSQESHAAAGAGRRHRRLGDPVEFPHRPGPAGDVGRRRRRAAARSADRRCRCVAGAAPRRGGAAAGGADAAARHPGRAPIRTASSFRREPPGCDRCAQPCRVCRSRPPTRWRGPNAR